MIEIKKKNWKQVSVSDWKRLKAIVEREDEAINKNVSTLAVLCECSENEIWALPMFEIQQLCNSIGWMDDFKFDKRANHKRFKIDGEEYVCNTDLAKMSVSAYVDFQIYVKDRENHMGEILACLIIPKGKNYGDGYDVAELAKKLEDNISIVVWNEVFFSLVKNLMYSIEATKIFLEATMKKMDEGTEKEQAKEALKMMEQMTAIFG